LPKLKILVEICIGREEERSIEEITKVAMSFSASPEMALM
jgi:hypothetical protein